VEAFVVNVRDAAKPDVEGLVNPLLVRCGAAAAVAAVAAAAAAAAAAEKYSGPAYTCQHSLLTAMLPHW
jgi:hypothetical protein